MKARLLRGICCIIFIWILSGIPVQVNAIRSLETPFVPAKDGLPIPSAPSDDIDQAQTLVLPGPSQEVFSDGNLKHFTSGRDLVDAMTSAQGNMTSDQIQSGSNLLTEKYMTLYTATGQTFVAPASGSTASFFTLNTSTTVFFNDQRAGDKVDILLQNYTFLSEDYMKKGIVRVIALLGSKLLSDVYELHVVSETETNFLSQRLQLLGGTMLATYASLPFITVELPYEKVFEFAQLELVAHVFLDKKYTVQIAESVPLIKEPVTWKQIEKQFGYSINGTGVKIAILDTGIDKNHPDLNDLDDNPNTNDPKVVEEKCFTDENHVWDGFGHGTHCASIAAGTGEASNHTRVGVAPAALLLNGKVLTDSGWGYDSWIISGIQWAVGRSAKVLSMSFGLSLNGDGSDPLSMAVDWAVDSGSLCAVAAGNDGTGGMFTAGTPGVSKKATTVGATSKIDTMAYFSSQGPTSDYRLKPDVCAPGVDIVAARANGTNMGTAIDEYYTRASGTSMATPHVAGEGALIIQAHPNWNSIMVKSSMMGSAKMLDGEHLWRQGAGRIDVCKAVNTTLFIVNPSASFGMLKLGDAANTTLTVMNLANTSTSITISTSTFCEGQITDYVRVNATSLSIPSNRNVTLALQVGPIDGKAPDGWYEGWVNVTSNAGFSTKASFLFACTRVETVRLAWTNSSVVSGTPENDVRPAIATDSNGLLYAAFEHSNATSRYYELYVSKSTDHGKTWSAILRAVDLSHNLGHPSISIDVGDNNNIFVAFEREWTSTDYDVFVLRCVGGSWSIIPVANVLGSNDRYPSITCEYQYGTSDRVYISYEYVYSYDDRDAIFAKSLDDGATWSLQKLHGGWPDSNVHCQTSIATTRGSDGNDYIYIAYKWGADYNTAYDIVIDKSKNRGSTWTQQWVCDELSRDKNWPSIVATHGNGTVVIAWHVYFDATYLNDVQYAFSTNNGDSWYVSWLAFGANANEENPAITADGQDSTSNVAFGHVHVAYWKDSKVCYKKALFDSPWLWTEAETVTDSAAYVPAAYNKPAITTYKHPYGLYLPVVTWTDQRSASCDIYCSRAAIQRNLTVVSSHDGPNPSVGDHVYFDGDSVTCNVSSPVTEKGVVWTCSGWNGTGSVQSSGNGTSVTFTLTEDSSVTWNWQAQIQTFQDDFESGSFNAWTGSSVTSGETTSVGRTTVHHGAYSAKFASNGSGGYEGAYCYKNLTASELYARGYFYVSQGTIAQNNSRAFFIVFRDANKNGLAYVGWKRTNGVLKWCLTTRLATTTIDTFSSTSPSTGRWYCVELHWKRDSTNGLAEVWVDGTRVCSLTGRNTASFGDVSQVQFGLAELYGCGNITAYCDCAKIAAAYVVPEPKVNSFTVSQNPFSPNGDGTKDTSTVNATFNVPVNWNLQVRTSSGTVLRTWTGTGSSLSLIWDGKNSTGYRVPDGSYTVRLSGTDMSGVTFTTTSVTVTVDTKLPTVTGVSVTPTSFSPRTGQTTKINYTLSESCYVTVNVYNSTGALKRILVDNVLQASGLQRVVWNGKDTSNNTLPPGTYTIKIYVVDKAGNKATPYPITKTVTIT